MLKKEYLMTMAAGALLTASLGAGALALADNATSTTGSATATAAEFHKPGVGGTVTAVNGSTITVTGMDGKTYTINAGSATVTKDMTVNVSDIAVGDMLMADGTVDGTTVTATQIHAGKMPAGGMMGGRGFGGPRGIHGTVSAISGTTLTITATNPKDSTTSTYTVDASSAKVLKGDGTTKPTDSTVSSVAVGDTVMVDGEISGTSVTAKMIIDGPMPKFDRQPGTPASAPTTAQ